MADNSYDHSSYQAGLDLFKESAGYKELEKQGFFSWGSQETFNICYQGGDPDALNLVNDVFQAENIAIPQGNDTIPDTQQIPQAQSLNLPHTPPPPKKQTELAIQGDLLLSLMAHNLHHLNLKLMNLQIRNSFSF